MAFWRRYDPDANNRIVEHIFPQNKKDKVYVVLFEYQIYGEPYENYYNVKKVFRNENNALIFCNEYNNKSAQLHKSKLDQPGGCMNYYEMEVE